MVLDFKDFCAQLENNEISLCSDSELLVYSRSDLDKKESLVELIGYPDNMMVDWDKHLGKLLQVPCCWILHDKDGCDPHIHIIIQWANNVKLSYYVKYCNQMLKKEGINPLTGKEYCPFKLIKPVKFPVQAYDYLIHDTDDAKAEGKYLYSRLERHCENGFDIHFVAQQDIQQKIMISEEISDYIDRYNIMDIKQVYKWLKTKGENYHDYYIVFQAHSGYFDRLCGGNWKEFERKKRKDGNS